jgi:hypothetical protein
MNYVKRNSVVWKYLLMYTAWWWLHKPKYAAYYHTIETNKLLIHSETWMREILMVIVLRRKQNEEFIWVYLVQVRIQRPICVYAVMNRFRKMRGLIWLVKRLSRHVKKDSVPSIWLMTRAAYSFHRSSLPCSLNVTTSLSAGASHAVYHHYHHATKDLKTFSFSRHCKQRDCVPQLMYCVYCLFRLGFLNIGPVAMETKVLRQAALSRLFGFPSHRKIVM